jgi:murein DD-endopeptidase MepM/ murein hydrolase activator NlpD
VEQPMTRNLRRIVALAVGGTMFAGALVAMAHAGSTLDDALSVRRDLREQIEQIHQTRHDRRVAIHQRIKQIWGRMGKQAGPSQVGHERYRRFRAMQRHQIRLLRARERALVKAAAVRVTSLQSQRTDLLNWIETYAIFRYCPVDGPHVVADNFGVIVNIPGVPRHIHQGNDIMSPEGTPIVAPFDGTATAGSSDLGGMSVDVYGELGHVYNAHLSSYGKLGPVRAGDIIGYVGATGDATSPHDHFEWHPGDGAAVDPHEYLMTVC